MTEPSSGRSPRWMRAALIVSLAANLLVIGAISGALLRGVGMVPREVNFALPYAQALSPQTRMSMIREVRRSGAAQAMRPRTRKIQYQAVVAALRAQPFDRAELDALVSDQAKAVWAFQGAAQTAWLNTVEGMSDEERAVYADAVEARAARRGGPRRAEPELR